MTTSQTAHPTEGERRPASLSFEVGQTIQRWGHEWKVCGIHLGGLKSESLIELAQVSPEAGWTGPWEFHPQLFIPEVLLSAALLVRPQGEEGLWRPISEAREDLHSHRLAWRHALELAIERADHPTDDADDRSYWRHELTVFDRVFTALSNQGKPSS